MALKGLSRYSVILALSLAACQGHEQRAPQMSPAYNIPSPDNGNSDEVFGQLVDRYEAPGRYDWQQPATVLGQLGSIGGRKVADIGAGTGYFTFRLAEAGASVIAIDIDPRFLQYINQRKENLPDSIRYEIETRLASAERAPLKSGEVDRVLVVNTFLFIENRPTYFQHVRQALAPGGMLLVVEYKSGALPVGPGPEVKVPPAQAILELEQAGFTRITLDEQSLPYQYILRAEQ